MEQVLPSHQNQGLGKASMNLASENMKQIRRRGDICYHDVPAEVEALLQQCQGMNALLPLPRFSRSNSIKHPLHSSFCLLLLLLLQGLVWRRPEHLGVLIHELQKALRARGGVLGALALQPVRQQHDQVAEVSPLLLAAGDEVVDDGLGAVGEVPELRLPHGQSQAGALLKGIAILVAQDGEL